MAVLAKPRAEKRAVRRASDGGKRVEYLAFVLAGVAVARVTYRRRLHA